MANYKVIAAETVRTLPAKDNFPPSRVDHLTLEANGTQVLATQFRRQDSPVAKPGDVLEGELGDNDRFDKERRKFKLASQGFQGGGGPRRRDPAETQAIQRQSARRDALAYIALKVQLGKIEDFDMSDVAKVTDGMERLLDPPAPPSDIPGDTDGLPSLNEPL